MLKHKIYILSPLDRDCVIRRDSRHCACACVEEFDRVAKVRGDTGTAEFLPKEQEVITGVESRAEIKEHDAGTATDL
jgi:hypothetical protein